jgi:hypothetical protein
LQAICARTPLDLRAAFAYAPVKARRSAMLEILADVSESDETDR